MMPLLLLYSFVLILLYQINFPEVSVGFWGWGVAGLIEIKANSASQLELELGIS